MADFELADRLKRLPPYLFAELDRKKKEVMKKGVDVINLGIGDPDLPTWPHIVAELQREAENPAHHQYPSYEGSLRFREAAAVWYMRRFGVSLDPEIEVISLIGSKEGIAHMPLAFVDPGDVVLVPDPGYPVYKAATIFAGGEPYPMPLLSENGFLPDIDAVPVDVAKRAKMMFLNYPNNPTAGTAGLDFFEKVVAFAKKHGIIVCHDAAYSEMYYEDSDRPHSILEVEGAKDVAVEFHSLSKTYNMTGWRIGWVSGNAGIVAGLGKIKTNVDSGVFGAIQRAAVAALEGDQSMLNKTRATYRERRDMMLEGLRAAGLHVEPCRATFYLWIRTPEGVSSTDFATMLLEKAGVVVTPGVGFGQFGEGFVRVSLTTSTSRLEQAARRIRELKLVR